MTSFVATSRRASFPPWTREAHAQNATVIEAIAAAACTYAAGGYWVVVGGIVGPWFLDPFRAAAGVRHVALDYVVLRPRRETSEHRAAAREAHVTVNHVRSLVTSGAARIDPAG